MILSRAHSAAGRHALSGWVIVGSLASLPVKIAGRALNRMRGERVAASSGISDMEEGMMTNLDRIKELEEALRFYAEERNIRFEGGGGHGGEQMVVTDFGKVARKALGMKEAQS